MDTYTLLREIADSWVLLAMFVFFLACVFWAFRPGSKALHDDAARSILRDKSPDEGSKSSKDGSRTPEYKEVLP